jgi:hypothetical protein
MENTGRHRHRQLFSEYDSNCTGNKSRNWQMRLPQVRKLLHIKGNKYQNEHTTYRGYKIFASSSTEIKC